MKPGATHRQLFLVMVILQIDLAAAALLAGIFVGPQILSAIELSDQAAWITSVSQGFALFICTGAILVIAIGFVTMFMGLSNASMRATAEGVIHSSSIRSFPCEEGYEHYIFSTVSYHVGGREFTSEGQHRFSSNSEDAAKAKLAGIRRGDRALVFFKPGEPGVIDLDEPPKDTWGSVFFGAVLIMGGLILLFLAGSSLGA